MKINKELISKIFWGVIFTVAGMLLAQLCFENIKSKHNARYYEQGLNFIKQKDYQNAYYNFSMVSKGNAFYCPAKYRAALAAQNLYDKNSAIIMHKDVINNCAKSIFEENSRYNLAVLYFQQEEFKKALTIFEELSKNARNEKYKIASNYFIGNIKKQTSPKLALKHYLKYIEDAPNGKYTKAIIENIKDLNLPLTSKQKYILGVALLKADLYKDAEIAFNNVPLEKSWYYLVVCAQKLGNYKNAKELILKNIENYGSNLSEEELQNVIDLYAQYNADKKNGYLLIAEKLFAKSLAGGDYALYKYISFLDKTEAIPYYSKIKNIYPDGRFASDALWNILYKNYKQEKYKKVIDLAEEHSKKYSNTIAAPKVLFFAGKACEKTKHFSKAKNYYNKIIEGYPDDYYAFRAKLLLDGRKTAWTIKGKKQISSTNSNINFPFEYLNLSKKDIETLDFLYKKGDWRLVSDLIDNNDIIQSWIEYNAGNKTTSIILARNYITKLKTKPAFSNIAYKLAYPLYYVEEINRYSKIYNLDPYLILSIIKEESHFDTKARSSVGASGLMQIMPDTASFIASKYGLKFDGDIYRNIDKNIELGAAYLDFALNHLSKKYLFAVAGYNGGHNAVKNWHSTLNYDDFDEFVEEIPYAETQNYIKKVFKTYWNYLNIYDRID